MKKIQDKEKTKSDIDIINISWPTPSFLNFLLENTIKLARFVVIENKFIIGNTKWFTISTLSSANCDNDVKHGKLS